MRRWISVFTLPGYLISSVVMGGFFLAGCGGGKTCSPNAETSCSYGSGGSGGVGISGGTSGGGTSGGVGGGTSGGGTSGGGTSGGSGGASGGSGGSGGVIKRPGGSPFVQAKALRPSFRLPVQGLVNGGQSRAVAGARVYVLQVNSSAYSNSSVSLLSSSGNPPDPIGNYVLTDEYGGFSIAGFYTCTAGRQVYLLARGGNSGGDGDNPAIGLMTLIGTCPETGNFDKATPFIFVNEVSTVTAAYAMAQSATDATHINLSKKSQDAVASFSAVQLASVATGAAYVEVPGKPGSKVPRSKIHTLANILAVCVNSSSPNSSGCKTLFANARGGEGTGAAEDTASAAINIARNPYAHVAALFKLQSALSAPFTPALDAVPPDFTLLMARDESRKDMEFARVRP